MKPRYLAPAVHIDDVFFLIGCCEIGSAVLKDFYPLYGAGQVSIGENGIHEFSKLALRKMSGKPGSGFQFDGKLGTISLPRSLPRGLAAPLLFHEMVHSTDQEYLGTWKKNDENWRIFYAKAEAALRRASLATGLAFADIQVEHLEKPVLDDILILKAFAEKYDHQRTFKAERKAYSALKVWLEQASDALPGYDEFISGQKDSGYVLDRAISDLEIIQGYGLDPIYLGRAKI